MNIDEEFKKDSEWIRHADLAGKEVTLTITAVGVTEFKEKDGYVKKQPALSFQGTDKRLGLNVTNREAIKAAYGPETDNWIGKPLVLYPTTTPFGDDIVPCIRVRCVLEQATGLPASPSMAAGLAAAAVVTPVNPGAERPEDMGDPLASDSVPF